MEFYSEQAKNDGHDPLPGFTPPAEVLNHELAKTYPFALVSGASHYILNSTFANNPDLGRQVGSPRVQINPTDARVREIESGQSIRIFNSRGAFTAEANISEEVRPGVLGTTKGLWLKMVGGTNLNATVDERDADLGGGSVFGDNRVDIEVVLSKPLPDHC